jgi:hypothetical protein
MIVSGNSIAGIGLVVLDEFPIAGPVVLEDVCKLDEWTGPGVNGSGCVLVDPDVSGHVLGVAGVVFVTFGEIVTVETDGSGCECKEGCVFVEWDVAAGDVDVDGVGVVVG